MKIRNGGHVLYSFESHSDTGTKRIKPSVFENVLKY